MEYLWLGLAIAGGMCFGFVLIIVVIFLAFKFWMRRAFKEFGELAEGMTKGIAPFMQPLRVQLEEMDEHEWADKAAVKRVMKPLRTLGFEDGGAYLIDEVPDVSVQALFEPTNAVYAVVYEHPDRGVWFELVSGYEDGASLTSTTAPPSGLDRPPTKVIERFDADADPNDVYQQHLANRPDQPPQPVSAERFKRDFEKAYADEMDWRFERGGFTEDEIRKNLKSMGTESTDEQIKQVHAMQQTQVNQWLQIKLAENFRAQANISDAKWRRTEHRVIFVHDRLTAEEVHGLFSNCLDWNKERAAQKKADAAEDVAVDKPARERFTQLTEMLPADRVPKKMGHVAQPVAADVYLIPEGDEDE